MTEEKPKRKKNYTEKMKESSRRYKREKMKSFAFRLSNERDAELIKVYDLIEDKADFFRDAIRRYAEENGIEIKTEDE